MHYKHFAVVQITFHQILSKLFLSASLLMSKKYVLYLFDSISWSFLNSLERSDIGNRNKKNTILSKKPGIKRPMYCAIIIHTISIFRLTNGDNIPISPMMNATHAAHCHENRKCSIKNPMEITKMVDFDVSDFIVFSIFGLKKCIYKWCKSATTSVNDDQAQQQKNYNNRR